MNFKKAFYESSAGLLVTDANFKVIWANRFEEEFYKKTVIGLDVLDCHRPENREKIRDFLTKFQAGEMKEFTKTAVGMLITYSSYTVNGEFAGLVRTRIRLVK
ncbi:hypothetical protein Desdi_1548 [Desulfitobacterium dichloroeliminans LMG P-21439]|uniref:PAS domain-containing protein n=1 Tax=Desulfitobacterium dichloroeliminans (strain LMG P-21439 / DCA1) TaxID=871963 RepID=L0F8T5_DESDL|nr:hypothetical protein [Desulfitobacterium dichloroeliminans]AGA69041.1 hypothetical protein Desdi_1548 [Desulfitobacterium dichloroeliminans LMG P-21439]